MTRYRLIRRLLQAAFFALFVLVFIRTRYGLGPDMSLGFFRLDPLLLAVSSVALRTLVALALPALAVVLLTLVFGRFFCGYVCPLGTTIDAFDRLIRRPSRPATRLRNGKYLVLVFLVVSAFLGASFISFFDPLVIFTRALALAFYPATLGIADLVMTVPRAGFTETFLALISFGLVLGLGFIAPRFWCRNACPLGGLLALCSKVSLLRFTFACDCRGCGLCAGVCPTGAIARKKAPATAAPESFRIDSAECIDCLACVDRCPHRSVRFRPALRPQGFDIGRREAIITLGSGILLAPLARNLFHARLQSRLIRPPASLPEPEFLAACLRCGRCMKVCPSNALQPCVFESGAAGIWTPRAAGRIGGCERNCNMCGQVCPTGAIRNLPLEEKSFAKMGTAIIDRTRCIAWAQDRVCLICDEACPYNSINALKDGANDTSGVLKPFVDWSLCIGCGICESRCPVTGTAAIQVYSSGEERRRTGSYRTDARVRSRECGQQEIKEDIPSGFILDDK